MIIMLLTWTNGTLSYVWFRLLGNSDLHKFLYGSLSIFAAFVFWFPSKKSLKNL